MTTTELTTLRWEYPHLLEDGSPIVASSETRSGTDTTPLAVIRLSAGTMAALDWTTELATAAAAIERGCRILWHLDMGLFTHLEFPVSQKAQFLTLDLAVKHFLDSIWERFHSVSVGCCLYRGEGLLSELFSCDIGLEDNWRGWLSDRHLQEEEVASLKEEHHALFCRDVAVEYIHLLAQRFSSTVPLYALIDVSNVASPLLQAQLLDRSVWDHVVPVACGAGSWDPCLWGNDGDGVELTLGCHDDLPSVGVCLPQPSALLAAGQSLDGPLKDLARKGVAYRVIPEDYLITEWNELDALVVSGASLGDQGLRKLQGFCAAGGTVITVDGSLQVPRQQDFQEWLFAGFQLIT